MCTQRRFRSAWESAQTDQSSLCVHWVVQDSSFLHADSKDSDQTGRMPRLIWVFAGRTCHFVGFAMRQPVLMHSNMSRYARKRTFGHVRPAKSQISLRICTVWSESSLGAFWIAKDAKCFMRTSKTDQTARMRRLIWVFVWRSCQNVSFLTIRLIFWRCALVLAEYIPACLLSK